jgi:hypothetical protein
LLVWLTLAVLLWLSPWLPIKEGPRLRRHLRLWHLLLVVAVVALFLAWVRDLFLADSLFSLSWR